MPRLIKLSLPVKGTSKLSDIFIIIDESTNSRTITKDSVVSAILEYEKEGLLIAGGDDRIMRAASDGNCAVTTIITGDPDTYRDELPEYFI